LGLVHGSALPFTRSMVAAATEESTTLVNGHAKPIKSKNQLRRLKAKQKKVAQQIQETPSENKAQENVKIEQNGSTEPSNNVEYVFEQLDVKGSGLEAFSDVFARFQLPPEESSEIKQDPSKGEVIYSDDDMASEADS
ncbi:hypothetical protein MPER_13744, partial [Moniliophthora perniciosa FA553]